MSLKCHHMQDMGVRTMTQNSKTVVFYAIFKFAFNAGLNVNFKTFFYYYYWFRAS